MHNRLRALALLLPLAPLAGCGAEKPPAPAARPPEVLVSLPVQREVTDYEIFTGRTDADQRVELKSRVDGYLEKINFVDGAMVKKDDVLFVIDSKLLKTELDRADALLGQARTKLRLAEAEAGRAKFALNRQAISSEEYDRIVGVLDEAREAQRVAQTNREAARVRLAYTEIKAPFDGRMSRRMVDVGTDVKVGETVLSTIVSVSPIDVYFDVDERTLLRRQLQQGALTELPKTSMAVRIGLVDEEGTYPHQGVVNFLDNRLDTGTGSMWMRARFVNPSRPVAPGMFARVRFLLGKPYKAMLVPEQSVGTDQGQKFLFVVDEKGKVEYRKVEVGQLHGALRVIKETDRKGEGVKPGERVVVAGLQRIRAGIDVTVKEVPVPNREGKPAAAEGYQGAARR